MLKAGGYFLIALILIGVSLFVAAPTIMDRAVPWYLESQGITSEFRFARPGLSGMTIHSAQVEIATMQIRANNVVVGYNLNSLGQRRLTDVHIDTLDIVIEPAGDTNEAMEVPSPWALLPMDRLRVDALRIENREPAATLTGEMDLDAARARANLLIESPMLPTNLDASLGLDPVGGVHVTLAQPGAPVALQLTGIPDGNAIFIEGMIDLTDDTFELLARLALPGELAGHLRGTLSATLPWPVVTPLDLQKITANGEFDLDVSGSLPAIEAIRLNADMTTRLANGEAVTRIDEDTALNLVLPDHEVGVIADAPFEVRWGWPGGAIRAADARLQVRLSETELLDQRVAFPAARAEIDRFNVDGTDMAIAGRIRSNEAKKAFPLGFMVNANLQDLSGTFDVSADHKITRPLLENELPGWQSEYDLDRGTLDLALAGNFRDTTAGVEVNGEGQVTLNDAVAHYEDMVAAGVGATLPLSMKQDGWRLGAGTINIGTVDVGVPLTEVQFELKTDGIELNMSDVSAQALDGEIQVDSLVYGIDAQRSQFDVAVADVSLESMLALVSDAVDGSGRLYGTLPVRLTPRGPFIEDGALTARPPGGYLSYGGTVPGSSPGLELAFRALQNFNYEHMNVDVEYVPEGDLDLMVRLQGSSPDVEDGRPIHFNLNISQNLLSLLESLRASDAMSERIQQRLRQD